MILRETRNKSAAAEQQIFCPIRAVLKTENTYSIPTFLTLSPETKSLTIDSCRFNQSFPSLTKAGNVPSWSTLRRRYWKNKAYYFASEYSEENVSRMMRGLAPQFDDGAGLYSMELHHMLGREGNNYYLFFEISPEGHAIVDPFRFFK